MVSDSDNTIIHINSNAFDCYLPLLADRVDLQVAIFHPLVHVQLPDCLILTVGRAVNMMHYFIIKPEDVGISIYTWK